MEKNYCSIEKIKFASFGPFSAAINLALNQTVSDGQLKPISGRIKHYFLMIVSLYLTSLSHHLRSFPIHEQILQQFHFDTLVY